MGLVWTVNTIWKDRKGTPLQDGCKAQLFDDKGNFVCEIIVKHSPFTYSTKQ